MAETPKAFLKFLARGALNVGGGGVGGFIAGPLGAAVGQYVGDWAFEQLAKIAEDTWAGWTAEKPAEADRRKEMETLIQASQPQIEAVCREIAREVAPDAPPEVQERLAAYTAQVPAMIRRTMRRPADPTGRTVPLDLAPRRAEDLLQILPPRPPRFRRGDRPLAGLDLALEEPLGVGGFGEVWKAVDPDDPHAPPVALKFCLDASAAASLRQEKALLNRIRSMPDVPSGFVRLIQTYLSADPPFVAYEYVEGGDLGALIQDWHARGEGGPAPEEAARVILRLAGTVAFAHRLDPPIVHRDLKPANILVRRGADGKTELKIADFGIGGVAAKAGVSETRRALTAGTPSHPTALRGAYTLLYACPEQMRGDNPDPRDDVFSLGVIWHQLLTGDLTTGAPSGRAWSRRLGGIGMSDALIDLLSECMEHSAADRPASAGDLHDRLTGLLDCRSGLQPDNPRLQPDNVGLESRPTPSAQGRSGLQPDNPGSQRGNVGLQSRPTPAVSPGAPVSPPAPVREDTRAPGDRPSSADGGPKGAAYTETAFGANIEMLWIPPGTFMMGSPETEEGRSSNETLHKVTLDGFYLGKYPVTQDQWKAVMGNTPSHFKGDGRLPVERVSWHDVMAFCEKLSQKTGRNYILPTEAQWEYACRAGTTTRFPSGDSDALPGRHAWYGGNSGVKTQPVGEKLANPWGLHDINGNVWEWCLDWYGDYPAEGTKNPTGPGSGEYRVLRGGSLRSGSNHFRPAYRYYGRPDRRSDDVGFRLAWTP